MIRSSSELKDRALKTLYGVCEPLPETTSKGVCVPKVKSSEDESQ